MATKKQKREAGELRQQMEAEAARQSGLKALEAARAKRERDETRREEEAALRKLRTIAKLVQNARKTLRGQSATNVIYDEYLLAMVNGWVKDRLDETNQLNKEI